MSNERYKHVAIYCRISQDGDGDELGVERQEEDCRAYCVDRGWKIARVFVDNDISAAGGKHRPDYEELLNAIERREIDAVVALHQDRITRNPWEMEEYVTICGTTKDGIPTHTLKQGILDLSTPTGRFQARIHVAVAQYYVELNQENNVRAKRQARERGQYDMPSCFGWRRVKGSKVPQPVIDELKHVPRIHAEFQAGRDLADIARDLAAEGVTTITGKPMNRQSVRSIIRNPTHAGLTEYMGNKPQRGRERGAIYDGDWQGVVSRETWEKSVGKLLDVTARAPGRWASREYLLAGIIYCGECNMPMTRDVPRIKRKTHGVGPVALSAVAYEALPEDEKANYGKMTDAAYKCRYSHAQVSQDKAESYIVPIVLGMVSDSKSAKNVVRLKSEIKRIDRKLREIAEMYEADEVTRAQVAAMSKKQRDRRDVIEGRLLALNTPLDIGSQEWWDALPLKERRAVIAGTARITVLPERKAGSKAVERKVFISPVED